MLLLVMLLDVDAVVENGSKTVHFCKQKSAPDFFIYGTI